MAFVRELHVSNLNHSSWSAGQLGSDDVCECGQDPLIPSKQRGDCLKLGRDSGAGASPDDPELREIVVWLSPLVSYDHEAKY